MRSTNWMWSFFWPGLGHAALGRHRLGFLFALWGALALFGVGIAGRLGVPRWLMVMEVVLVAVVAAWHARRCEQSGTHGG